MSNNTLKMDIPADKAAAVAKFLAGLSISENNSSSSSSSSIRNESWARMDLDSDDEGDEGDENVIEICDVKEVKDYNYDYSTDSYSFLIRFSDRTEEWVRDVDCSCESLIAKFLHSRGINTSYLFCRVSTKGQVGEDHVSLDAQETELKRAMAENAPSQQYRTKVIKVAASAYKNIPKELRELGEIMESGDYLYVYRVDRLSRNIIKYLAWIEDLHDRGVKIYSAAEKLFYGDRKLSFIKSIVEANEESEKIGDRIRMSIRQRRERGDEWVGKLPYGKKYERTQSGKLVIVPDKAAMAVILRVKKEKGYGRSMRARYASIAKKLNRERFYKYKSADGKGKRWTANMVQRVKETVVGREK